MRQVFLGTCCSQTKWKVAFGEQSANKRSVVSAGCFGWIGCLLHCASEAATSHPCMCARSRSRTAGRDNMAKIYSEKAFLNRHQRSSSKTPDEELAVIENGDSRLAAQSKNIARFHLNQWGGPGTLCHICHISRAHSLCEETSDRTLSSVSHRNSFRGAGAVARYSIVSNETYPWS